jgi:uncharacterized Rossmann fold enzyme|tara:strand:- start:281 stop:1036 length:756 start_codon:yes stop_codon:yes gene_type:complete
MDRPTDLLPVVDELLAIQTEVREHFGWKLDLDSNSALSMLETVEASEINDWTRPRRAATVAGLIRRMVLRPTEVAVLGAAVEAEEVLRVLERPVLLVAADGSAGVLSTLPDSTAERAWSRLACVVSDGDGGQGIIEAVKRGIPVFLHAHGDNVAEWESLLEIAAGASTPSPLVLTHQTPASIPGMHNPGGFTDGDRAVCMIRSMGVPKESITMLGTRTDVVGRWSGVTDAETKMEKLQWMDKVLRALEIEY